MANVATSQYNSRASSKLLWEWNGTDITQFGDGVGTPDHTYGSPDGTLSVGAPHTASIDVPSGNVLKYTTGTATSAAVVFFINDLPALPERFIYRIRLGPYAAGCSPIAYLAGQDELHSLAFAWFSTQTTWQIGNNNSGIFEAGIYLRAGGPQTVDSGVVFEFDVMLRDPDTGVDPQINASVINQAISVPGYPRGGLSWTTWGGSTAAYDSSWQSGGTIKNPGVLFTCNGTAATSWVGEMQIFSHPWTKEA